LIFEILNVKNDFWKNILFHKNPNKYQIKILNCEKNEPIKILVSLEIYANQNHQKAHPNIDTIPNSIHKNHLLSKWWKSIFLRESKIHEIISKKAPKNQKNDSFSWYTKYDSKITTTLSKESIKVAIEAGRNLKE